MLIEYVQNTKRYIILIRYMITYYLVEEKLFTATLCHETLTLTSLTSNQWLICNYKTIHIGSN